MEQNAITKVFNTWALLFGIENVDVSQPMKAQVPDFDKIDELMAIMAVEDILGDDLSEEEIQKLKDEGFTAAALNPIFA